MFVSFTDERQGRMYEMVNFNLNNSALWNQEGMLPRMAEFDMKAASNAFPLNKQKEGNLRAHRQRYEESASIEYRNSLIDTPVSPARVLWPLGPSGFYEIPYTIKEGDFTEWMVQNLILWGMKHIEQGSNIRFRPAVVTDKNFIVFVNGEGCLSIVGRHPNERPQRISLNVPRCMFQRVVLHEILHAVGLYHEHQRSDATEFVQISENAPALWETYITINPVIPTHLVPYNIGSIMHYNNFIRAKNPNHQHLLEQSAATLSPCDWHHLNLLYPGRVKPPPCEPHTVLKACEPLPSCPYGKQCQNMCDIDCNIGLPRGDVPDVLNLPNKPFCQYKNGKVYPPLPEALQAQIDQLKAEMV